jgi:predicted ester cyclase
MVIEEGRTMSADENRIIARIPYDAFNAREFDRIAEITAPDAKWVNIITGETFRGPDGFEQNLHVWARAFPDARLEITNIVADEDSAVVEFTGTGTNIGPLPTPIGEIPPTGRRAEQQFCDVYDISNGKVTQVRTYFDVSSLMAYVNVPDAVRQLGLSG